MNHPLAANNLSEPITGAPARGETGIPPWDRRTWPRWAVPAVVTFALVVVSVVGYFARETLVSIFEPPPYQGAPARESPVSILGPNLIAVSSGSPLENRLRVVAARRESYEFPILNVTGSVLARLGKGPDDAESRWDFASTEVATAYADWLNAGADVVVLAKQAAKVRELVQVRIDFLRTERDRKEKNFPLGAVSERDLISARADFLQADLQGQRDITEAEAAVKKTIRNRGLLERQLFQAGVDPEVVRKATENLVLVVAEVPEAKVGLVAVGQQCEARFFGDPGTSHKGRVGRIGPSVAKDRRTLRVTFELVNPSGRLLPGMFAEIGLGTETRQPLTIPTEALLHAGTDDYVLKEQGPGVYRPVKVKVDEPRQFSPGSVAMNQAGSRVPVIEGLSDGDRVISTGSILLKPMLVKVLNGAGFAATN